MKKCAKAMFDKDIEAFVVYVALLTLKMIIHSARKAQSALLIAKKVTTLTKYADFANIFLKK